VVSAPRRGASGLPLALDRLRLRHAFEARNDVRFGAYIGGASRRGEHQQHGAAPNMASLRPTALTPEADEARLEAE
jgi:hypothetical protein